MNTIDSYFEYELDITPASLANLITILLIRKKILLFQTAPLK